MSFLNRLLLKNMRQDEPDYQEGDTASFLAKVLAPTDRLDQRQRVANTRCDSLRDTQEVNRLDLQYALFHQIFHGDYLAPIGQPRAILDVGTKSGRWPCAMAQAFPEAHVVGCDLVEQSIDRRSAPPNYQFIEADVTKRLPFPDQHFDFVYQRLAFLTLPGFWEKEVRELARVTRPGGWVELVEFIFANQHAGPAALRLWSWLRATSQRRGVDISQIPQLDIYLRNAGLVNISKCYFPIPLGQRGGAIGAMMAANLSALAHSLKPLAVFHLGVSSRKFDQALAALQQEWEKWPTTVKVCVAYGQRVV